MKNLFGEEVSDKIVVRKNMGEFQNKRFKMYYRFGEKEKCCKNCKFRYSVQYANIYHKCSILGGSSSSASDIRLKMVCNHWEVKNERD